MSAVYPEPQAAQADSQSDVVSSSHSAPPVHPTEAQPPSPADKLTKAGRKPRKQSVKKAVSDSTACTTVVHRGKGKDSLESLTRAVNAEKNQIDGLQRKEAVHAFRAGGLLVRIQDHLKTGSGWCQWQRDNKWNRGTAARYIKLFKLAKKEERLKGMTITEAEATFCAREPKKTKPTTAAPTKPTSDIVESPTAQARDFVAQGLAALCELRHGERQANQAELAELKTLISKLMEVVAELEGK